MSALNENALAELESIGLTEREWARVNWMRGAWSGDRCGCMDDRCIGHHHASEDNCGCLPAALADWFNGDPFRVFAVKPPGPLSRLRRVRGYLQQNGFDYTRQPTSVTDYRYSDQRLTGPQQRRARKKFNRSWRA